VGIVSDSELLVMFVTVDDESNYKNISGWQIIIEWRRLGKRSKGRNGKLTTRI
jgi:hypothetical protein